MWTVYVGGNVFIPGTDNVGCTENGTSAPISSGDLRRKLARYRHDDPISQYGGPRTGTVEPAALSRGWTGGTKIRLQQHQRHFFRLQQFLHVSTMDSWDGRETRIWHMSI